MLGCFTLLWAFLCPGKSPTFFRGEVFRDCQTWAVPASLLSPLQLVIHSCNWSSQRRSWDTREARSFCGAWSTSRPATSTGTGSRKASLHRDSSGWAYPVGMCSGIQFWNQIKSQAWTTTMAIAVPFSCWTWRRGMRACTTVQPGTSTALGAKQDPAQKGLLLPDPARPSTRSLTLDPLGFSVSCK